jgi:hypothetical protein
LPIRIKLLIGLFFSLVIFNLTVGILAQRHLAENDRNYSSILNQLIPFQDNMRTVSLQATRTLAYTMLYSNDKVHETGRALAIKQAGEVSDKIYALMAKGPFPSAELEQGFNEVRAKRALWRSYLASYLDGLQQGNKSAADNVLNEQLYPALFSYLTGLESYCDSYQNAYLLVSNQLSQDIRKSQNLVFGLSLIPLLLLFVLPVFLVLFAIIVLLILILKPANKPTESSEEYNDRQEP